MMRKYVSITLCVLIGIGLTGCAKTIEQIAQPNLYNWQQYGTSVERYLEATDYLAQAEAMERNLALSHRSNQSVPPGFHLHLGMLYGQLGYASRMQNEFALEKALYPESSHLVNFIVRLNKRKGGMK